MILQQLLFQALSSDMRVITTWTNPLGFKKKNGRDIADITCLHKVFSGYIDGSLSFFVSYLKFFQTLGETFFYLTCHLYNFLC